MRLLFFLKKNKSRLLRILVFLVAIWYSIGYFPILNFEGDSALFSAGCERLYNNGFSIPPDYFYLWDMQPLTGVLVVAVKYILPSFSCEQIYSVLTILFSLSFWFLSAFFITKLTKFRWEYCFLALTLLPEIYCIGYYPNTTIFASLTFICGLWLMLKRPLNLSSILCLGIAPLFRVDVLIIYPVVLFVQLNQNKNWRKSVINTFMYACSTLVACVLLFWILGANPFNTLYQAGQIAEQRIGDSGFVSFLKINTTFYMWASLLLILIGFITLIKNKKYVLLFLSLLPIFFLYKTYFYATAAKHIQYLIPFSGILIVSSLEIIKKQISEKKYLFTSLIFILFIIQFFIGIRVYPQNKPWISKSYSVQYSQPTIINVTTIRVNKTNVSFVLGVGQPVSTADEIMLISGNFFTPIYYHKIKETELSERRKLLQMLENNKSDTISFLTTQASEWPLSQLLHGNGFYLKKIDKPIYTFVKGNKTVIVTRVDLERNVAAINELLNSYNKPYFLYVNWDWQMYYVNQNLTIAEPLTNKLSIVK